jgi:hypothetical protein
MKIVSSTLTVELIVAAGQDLAEITNNQAQHVQVSNPLSVFSLER